MNKTIDDIVEEKSVFKEIYRQGKTIMKSNLGAAGAAISLAYTVTYLADNVFGTESKELLTGISTAADLAGYWAAYIGISIYLDKEKYYQNGKPDWKEIWKKAGETNAVFWIVKGTYTPLRILGHNWLVNKGLEPEVAGAATQAALTGVYTLGLPPAIYAYHKVVEKIGTVKTKFTNNQKPRPEGRGMHP